MNKKIKPSKKRLILVVSAILLIMLTTTLNAQSFLKTKFQNFVLYPSSTSQTEPIIVNHPFNKNILFVSANTIRFSPFFVSEGVYVSEDGGISWRGSDTCKGEYINFHGGDPAIAIDKNGRFILTRLGRTPFVGLFVHYSTDNGKTWSFQNQINDHDLERSAVASDVFPTSPFYGRTYAIWVRFIPPYALYFSYTDDGGVTWSQPRQINNPTQRCSGGDIVIGRNGEVYITWAVVSASSPYSEQFIGFAKSTDGGNSWQVTEKAFQVNGIQGYLPQKQNIRVNGLPQIEIDLSGGERDGWIYIVTTQKNFGAAGSDPDIILHRSTDGGITWSNPVRVNQDELNNGRIQYFPAITIDKSGGINILYYDDRLTTSDSTGVFLSRSTDGGLTFRDYQISDHNFKPVAIGGLGAGYQGDIIALTSVDSVLIPVWMDNSTGNYQLWTSRINLGELTGVEDNENLPDEFLLYQNYPNPFNPSTKIKFQLKESGFTTLKIYDVLGREVYNLLEKDLKAGEYEIEFDLNRLNIHLNSGIYFYTLTSGSFLQTKKMVILK